MDLLDNYKKAWKNQPEEASKLSTIEIYKLAHSRSASIVKWIFIIGILEFVGLNTLSFFMDIDKANEELNALGLEKFMFYFNFIYYGVLAYFLILFYLNYKRISVIDNTRVLMKKILVTRKTVKQYVIFNLIVIALIVIIVAITTIKSEFDIVSGTNIMLTIIFILGFLGLILGIMWLFYQLLYGLLLKKLNTNYKELAKLDTNS
tara:strand:- start:720 stop:1334 length:615 start_codon:yes stop_codon:yes gene_type:complete